MVKVRGSHHVRTKRVYAQRKLALQKQELAREEEKLDAQEKRQLPEYDLDDNGRFAGYDAIFRCEGENYEALHRVLKKIMRPAHYRTWAAANRDKGNGPPPCLTAREIAEHVGRHKRTIEIDLQEMRKSKLLYMQPVQRDGRWVMEMHCDFLYRLVHEYLMWEQSADYIPPERLYFEYITLPPDRKRQLLLFEDYRKVLGKKKPGPKTKKKSNCHEGLIGHQSYVGDQPQHIHSASPVAPTAPQGNTERSIYSKPPVPPALPQADRSGSAHPNNTSKQQVSQGRTRSMTEQHVSHEHIQNASNQHVSQEFTRSAAKQQVSQEHTSGNVSQEVPIMPVKAQEFTLKDSTGKIYVYPTSSLPMFFVDLPEEHDELHGTPEFAYHVDKEDILHIDGLHVPFLWDLLRCTRATYERSHFHHRAAFEPEIQRLFDPKAVGVWACYIPENHEVMLMMEYDPERGNIDEYMKFLAKDMENVLCYQDEDLKNDIVPFGEDEISLFEIQEDAVRHYVVPDEPLDLSVEGVWTPELSFFVDFAHPATRFFIPYIDFPPEVASTFPDYQMGVWVSMRPGEREAYVQPCYELFMEGIKAQPAHFAIVEARIRYATSPQSEEQTDMSDMADAMSTPLPEQLTDEIPAILTDTSEAQEVTDDYVLETQEVTDDYVPETQEVTEGYASEAQEVINDYVPKAQEVINDYSKEKADTTVSLTASGQVLIEDTEKLHKIAMPTNKAGGQELHCDRSMKEHRTSVSAEPQGPKTAPSPVVNGTLSGLNLAHRSFSRRIVGNRRGKQEQESRTRPVFVNVQEIVHDDGMGTSYPSIVPLLQDFMRTKLLGNDTVRRYFIPFVILKSPGIENSFPAGTDGVWLWKQPTDPIVHVKPSCMAIDPYLKNRSATSIAVGKVVDDDGYLYFGKAKGTPTSSIQQPRADEYDHARSEAPPLEQAGVSRPSAPRVQQPRADEYGNARSEAPPLEQAGVSRPSAPRVQQPRADEHDHARSEAPPLEQAGVSRPSAPRTQQPRVDKYGNALSEASLSEHQRAGRKPPSRTEGSRVDNYGNVISEVPSLDYYGGGRTSAPRTQQPRVDEYGNKVPASPPVGEPRGRGMSASRIERSDSHDYGKPSSAPPSFSVPQKQYQALIKRAQDGHGKGLQRLI